MVFKFSRGEPPIQPKNGTHRAKLVSIEECKVKVFENNKPTNQVRDGIRFNWYFGKANKADGSKVEVKIKEEMNLYIGLSKNPSAFVKRLRALRPGVTDELLKDDTALNQILHEAVNKVYFVSTEQNDKGWAKITGIVPPPSDELETETVATPPPPPPVMEEPPPAPVEEMPAMDDPDADEMGDAPVDEVSFDDDDIPF